jgi:GT2 family glycosyltransferase
MPESGGVPRIAVVVIGRNEGDRLVRCLESVWAMNYPRDALDLIYVDSQSTDDSIDRAKDLNARVIEVEPERPCAAVGRNAGWRAADAPYVLFLDGDTILDPNFVRTGLAAFENGPGSHESDIAVVFGHRREIATDDSIYNRVLDLDWIWPLGELDFCGGDALIRRSALEAVDGYDDTLIAGEEPDMCRRMRGLGWRILHIDAPMTGHDMAMHSFGQYWRRATRTGHAYSEVSARFADTDEQFWTADSKRNYIHAAVVAATPVAVVLGATVMRPAIPVLGAAAFWTAVIVRSTRRTAWKQAPAATRVAYAVHSHVQQVPIAVGQLTERSLRRRGRRQGLIEYK